MTVVRSENIDTEKAQVATTLGQKRSLSTCECGGEIIDLNTDSGFWT